MRCPEVGSGVDTSLGIMVKCFTSWKKFLPALACLTAPGARALLEQTMNITEGFMGTATPQPTLNRLRQTLAGIDPSHAARLTGEERLVGLTAPIDARARRRARLRRAA